VQLFLKIFPQDLLDYLVQLLGSDRQDQLRDFVDDVERVRQGETLPVVQLSHKAVDTEAILSKQRPPPPPAITVAPKTMKSIQPKKVPPSKSVNKPKLNSGRQQLANSNVPNKSNTKKGTGIVQPQSQISDKIQPPKQQQQQEKETNQNHEKKRPSQGTATIVCGCFGTTHQALTNCLHCGRISCEREGYDYCPFCNYMIEKDRSSNTTNYLIYDNNNTTTTNKNEAWEQKERLLQYDREFVQRTIILDDQADYYNQATSNWLTESEEKKAQQLEQIRYNDIQTRGKMKLHLSDV
jgi:Putative zinc finger motif, C2HC5-type